MPLDVVTGAFGYTGRAIAARLLGAGRQLRTLTGHPAAHNPFGDRVLPRPLDFADPDGLARALDGADTLYNTYWIRFARGELTHDTAVAHSETLFRAARAAGVRRIVHISITGAQPDSPLPYFRGKARVEEALRAAGPGWAIVRPALIYGARDVLLHNIAWILRRLPVFAIFGDGLYPVQPVHVDDLAALAVRLGASEEDTELDAVGPEVYTYEELVRAIAAALGRRPRMLHVSPALGWTLAAGLGALVGDVVVTRDEIQGLMAGLLRSHRAPTCSRRVSDWLQADAAALGVRWVSEIRRHYTDPRRAR